VPKGRQARQELWVLWVLWDRRVLRGSEL
jgi:hypothetical protein